MRHAHAELVFALAARLGRTAAEVEALSAREVRGWLAHFRRAAHAADQAARGEADDGALDLRAVDRATLRAAFHH
jgi:hypothetical protein